MKYPKCALSQLINSFWGRRGPDWPLAVEPGNIARWAHLDYAARALASRYLLGFMTTHRAYLSIIKPPNAGCFLSFLLAVTQSTYKHLLFTSILSSPSYTRSIYFQPPPCSTSLSQPSFLPAWPWLPQPTPANLQETVSRMLCPHQLPWFSQPPSHPHSGLKPPTPPISSPKSNKAWCLTPGQPGTAAFPIA